MNEQISEDGKVMVKKVEEATALAIGKPLTEEQALDWSIRAARAIQAVGSRGSTVYKLSDTVKALTVAMGAKSTDLQIAAARAASTIKSAPAQQAVIALAVNAKTDETVRIAAFQAASRSVRQYGSDATNEQANAVIEVVLAKGTHELRQAAAQLLGSMNLASEKTPQLILSTDAID
jgi:predicted ATPase